MNRRDFYKLLFAATAATAIGIKSTVAETFINGAKLTSDHLGLMFNLQKLKVKDNTCGLIFNLQYRVLDPSKYQAIQTLNETNTIKFSDEIPTIELLFEKAAIEFKNLVKGDATNCVKLFIDEILSNINVTPNSDIFTETRRIFIRSRRGPGNCVMLHTSKKDTDLLSTFKRTNIIYSDHMPKDRCIVWYNGYEFYDGAFTIAHDETDINNYVFAVHDNFKNYCSVLAV